MNNFVAFNYKRVNSAKVFGDTLRVLHNSSRMQNSMLVIGGSFFSAPLINRIYKNGLHVEAGAPNDLMFPNIL